MTKVVTAEEMRGIDRRTIEEFGIPGPVLMERAGLSVAGKIIGLFERRKVIVLSGGGNNGGDGLVAARNLFNMGWNVKVLLLAKEDKLSPDCLAQYRTAKKMGIPIEFRTSINVRDLHSSVVVDAIFGTGLDKPVIPPISDLIRFLNKSDVPVISIDVPSGISSDNGQIMGEAVRADYTVTFGLPKIGHFLYPGAEFTGRLFVEEIGFPRELLNAEGLKIRTVEKEPMSVLVPERPGYSYKGDYGHVLLIAGSRGKTGAAFMTSKACLRTGAGMVTIGVPETLSDIFQGRVTEEMVLPLSDDGRGMLSSDALETILNFASQRADIIAIGPGIGVSDGTRRIMTELILTSPVSLVIDADGLNSLSGAWDVLKKAKSPVILTPHVGEMARLLRQRSAVGAYCNTPVQQSGTADMTEKEISELLRQLESDRINTAVSFSRDTGTYLVLKGSPTLIAEPEGKVFINTTGNPGMATAGAGDVLTGMIAALLGQGLNPLDASVLGAYMHGIGGDIAASEKGMHSLIATDIIEKIPDAFASLRNR